MIEFTMRLELRTRAMAYLSASFAKVRNEITIGACYH